MAQLVDNRKRGISPLQSSLHSVAEMEEYERARANLPAAPPWLQDFNPFKRLPDIPTSRIEQAGARMSSYGRSKYDRTLPLSLDLTEEDLQEHRGKSQSGASKITHGLINMGTKAITTALDGLVGLGFGVGNMIINGGEDGYWTAFRDNWFSRSMFDIQQAVSEATPLYSTREERAAREENWLNSLGSANFWASFLENTGFTAGMALSAYVTGGLSTAGQSIGVISKVAKEVALRTGTSVARVQKAILAGEHAFDGVDFAKEVIKSAGTLRRRSSLGNMIGMGMSSVSEGRVEGFNHAEEYRKARLSELESPSGQRQMIIATRDQFLTEYGRDPSPGELEQLVSINAGLARERIEENARVQGNVVMGINIPLLTLSNMALWGKSVKAFARKAAPPPRVPGASSRVKEVLVDGKPSLVLRGQSVAGKIGGSAKATAKGFARGIGEGEEEMLQLSAQKATELYFNQDFNAPGTFMGIQYDPEVSRDQYNWWEAGVKGILDTHGDWKNWEEFGYGFLMGTTGLPSLKKVKGGFVPTLPDTILKPLMDYHRETKELKSLVETANKRLEDPGFRARWFGTIRHNVLDRKIDDALAAGDTFTAKNAEDAQLISDLILFDKLGQLPLLERLALEETAHLESIAGDESNLSEAKLQERRDWVAGTRLLFSRPRGENGETADTGDSPLNAMTDSDIINMALDSSRKTVDATRRYGKIIESTRQLYGNNLDDDTFQELVYLVGSIDSFEERASNLADRMINLAEKAGIDKEKLKFTRNGEVIEMTFPEIIRAFPGQSFIEIFFDDKTLKPTKGTFYHAIRSLLDTSSDFSKEDASKINWDLARLSAAERALRPGKHSSSESRQREHAEARAAFDAYVSKLSPYFAMARDVTDYLRIIRARTRLVGLLNHGRLAPRVVTEAIKKDREKAEAALENTLLEEAWEKLLQVKSAREAIDLLVGGKGDEDTGLRRKLLERARERGMTPGIDGYNVFVAEAVEMIQLREELLDAIDMLGEPGDTVESEPVGDPGEVVDNDPNADVQRFAGTLRVLVNVMFENATNLSSMLETDVSRVLDTLTSSRYMLLLQSLEQSRHPGSVLEDGSLARAYEIVARSIHDGRYKTRVPSEPVTKSEAELSLYNIGEFSYDPGKTVAENLRAVLSAIKTHIFQPGEPFTSDRVSSLLERLAGLKKELPGIPGDHARAILHEELSRLEKVLKEIIPVVETRPDAPSKSLEKKYKDKFRRRAKSGYLAASGFRPGTSDMGDALQEAFDTLGGILQEARSAGVTINPINFEYHARLLDLLVAHEKALEESAASDIPSAGTPVETPGVPVEEESPVDGTGVSPGVSTSQEASNEAVAGPVTIPGEKGKTADIDGVNKGGTVAIDDAVNESDNNPPGEEIDEESELVLAGEEEQEDETGVLGIIGRDSRLDSPGAVFVRINEDGSTRDLTPEEVKEIEELVMAAQDNSLEPGDFLQTVLNSGFGLNARYLGIYSSLSREQQDDFLSRVLDGIASNVQDVYREGGKRLRPGSPAVKRLLESRVRKFIKERGVKIRVKHDSDYAKNDENRFRKGIYNTATKEIVLNIDRAKDYDDAVKTILHETIGHHATRELIGKERYDAYMRQLYNRASDEIKRAVDKQRKKKNWSLERAMDEYIAGLAEKGEFLTAEEKSLWQRFVAWVKSLFHPGDTSVDDVALNNLLRQSYMALRGKTPYLTREIRYREEEELSRVNERFNEELDKFKAGTLDGVLHLGKPLNILQASGIRSGEITITSQTLKKHLEKHGLTTRDLKDLAKAIQSPIMVYEWGTKARSTIIITELTTSDNRKITVAIKIGRDGQDLSVNEVASVHGKEIDRFLGEMGNAKEGGLSKALKYVNKEKALEWLGIAPPWGAAQANQEHNSIAKVIQEFENPKLPGENNNLRYREDEEELARINERFNDGLNNPEGKTFNLGNPSNIVLSAGLPNKPYKLHGDKIIHKAKKHGYRPQDISNLPKALANPIAVFKGENDIFNILTELEINGRKVLVGVETAKDNEINFNFIATVFGKREYSIVKWINQKKGTYYNKEEALNYLRSSAPIADATYNSELDSATKVIQEFENPKLPGENNNLRYREDDSYSPREKDNYRDNPVTLPGIITSNNEINYEELDRRTAHVLSREWRIKSLPAVADDGLAPWGRRNVEATILAISARESWLRLQPGYRHGKIDELSWYGPGDPESITRDPSNNRQDSVERGLQVETVWSENGGRANSESTYFDGTIRESKEGGIDNSREQARDRLILNPFSRQQEQETESRILESWARKEGIFHEEDFFDQGTRLGYGAENDVYPGSTEDTVIKVINPYVFSTNLRDFLVNRVLFFNHLFPETGLKITGVSRKSGAIRLVLEQKRVTGRSLEKELPTTLGLENFSSFGEIIIPGFNEFMLEKGFKHYGRCSYRDKIFIINDLRLSNIIKNEDGQFYIIDAIPSLIPSFEEIEDTGIRYRDGEEEDIRQEAIRSGIFMKAPNGRPSHLSEHDWARVRTRSFKEKHGDWEKAGRIEKLRESTPVEITGEEYKGKYELTRDSAKDYIKNNLRGIYTNMDTGEQVELSHVGMDKVTSHGERDHAHLKSIVAIPRLIEESIFIEELLNEKNDSRYDSYRYHVAGMKIGGEDYTAKVVIGVKDGRKYYDHELTRIEKTKLIDDLNLIAKQVANQSVAGFTPTEGVPLPSYTTSKDTRLISILQNNFRGNLDENGEPLMDDDLRYRDPEPSSLDDPSRENQGTPRKGTGTRYTIKYAREPVGVPISQLTSSLLKVDVSSLDPNETFIVRYSFVPHGSDKGKFVVSPSSNPSVNISLPLDVGDARRAEEAWKKAHDETLDSRHEESPPVAPGDNHVAVIVPSLPPASPSGRLTTGVSELDEETYRDERRFVPKDDPSLGERHGANMIARVKFLRDAGAFDYLDSGKLNPNDEVFVIGDPAYWERLMNVEIPGGGNNRGEVFQSFPLLLAVRVPTGTSTTRLIDGQHYQIIGTFPRDGSISSRDLATSSRSSELRDMALSRLRKNSTDKSSFLVNIPGTSTPITTRVLSVSNGRLSFSGETTRPLRQSLSRPDEEPVFGILKKNTLWTSKPGIKVVGTDNWNVETKPGSVGLPYLLVKIPGREHYMPVALLPVRVGDASFNLESPLPFFSHLRSLLKKLSELELPPRASEKLGSTSKALDTIYTSLQDFLAVNSSNFGLHVRFVASAVNPRYPGSIVLELEKKNTGGDPLVTSITIATIGDNGTVTRVNSEQVYREIVEVLKRYNIPVEISIKYLKDRNDRSRYTRSLLNADLLHSNLLSDKVRGVHAILEELDGNYRAVTSPVINHSLVPGNSLETASRQQEPLDAGSREVGITPGMDSPGELLLFREGSPNLEQTTSRIKRAQVRIGCHVL